MQRRGGGGSTRPTPGGMPAPPDINGAQRGLGYGGAYNKGGYGGKMGNVNRASNNMFAQFNAWQDPNISDGGASAGTLQRGWGGWGSDALKGMLGTKLNGFLNQFSTGGDRERAMNLLGYNNGGNPYVPQVPRGTNQWYRARANENQQTGAYSAPGTYQHQSAGASADTVGTFGGYTGFTTVGADGSAQYTPLDVNARGRTRRTRTFGQVM